MLLVPARVAEAGASSRVTSLRLLLGSRLYAELSTLLIDDHNSVRDVADSSGSL